MEEITLPAISQSETSEMLDLRAQKEAALNKAAEILSSQENLFEEGFYTTTLESKGIGTYEITTTAPTDLGLEFQAAMSEALQADLALRGIERPTPQDLLVVGALNFRSAQRLRKSAAEAEGAKKSSESEFKIRGIKAGRHNLTTLSGLVSTFYTNSKYPSEKRERGESNETSESQADAASAIFRQTKMQLGILFGITDPRQLDNSMREIMPGAISFREFGKRAEESIKLTGFIENIASNPTGEVALPSLRRG